MKAAALIDHIEEARKLEMQLMEKGMIVLYAEEDRKSSKIMVRGACNHLTEGEAESLVEHVQGFRWLAEQRVRSS